VSTPEDDIKQADEFLSYPEAFTRQDKLAYCMGYLEALRIIRQSTFVLSERADKSFYFVLESK
jgi:hypothetical protein